MTMEIHRGKFRAWHQMLRHHERRTRVVFSDRRGWEFRLLPLPRATDDLPRTPDLRGERRGREHEQQQGPNNASHESSREVGSETA